ncbi:MAG: hypothetical protein OQJ99_08840 [Rhodospirillales bacterium]|nr:hypothetical protein [Rhodospirillales bacterium]MCW8861301.1 hypothetical protein [Rhodospirillales bacterium]MCW8969625.1 hypothetical protein [Rhodospirillales bacterium]
MTEAPTDSAVAPDSTAEDAAWVVVETPFSTESLRAFCDDVERLFRINPMLEFLAWEPQGGSSFRMAVKNLSNGRNEESLLTVTQRDDGLDIAYDGTLKTRTLFRIEDGEKGASLRITDDYAGTPTDERATRVDEVDKSLLPWGRDLHRYFRAWARWGWLSPWRWYMRRVWQPMKPSARRIAYMLWMVTLFEVAAIAAIVLLWVFGGIREL